MAEVIGINGKRIQVHPSYRFEENEWFNIPETVRKQLMQLRKEYQEAKRQRTDNSTYQGSRNSTAPRHVQEFESYPTNIMPPPNPPQGHGIPVAPPPPSPYLSVNQMKTHDDQSHVSQITHQTQGSSVMGGRNAQALRSRNPANQPRNISSVVTKRRISKYNAQITEPLVNTIAENEADTNADTCCLGNNFIPLYYTNRTADVYPYSDAYEPIENVPIVSGATAYDHPNGNTYILVFNESLYYGQQMKHSLINPNQIRFNGLDFWDNPLRDDELYMELDDDLRIPLQFKGTKCVFTSRVPTKEELNTCIHYHITSSDTWEPTDIDLNTIKRISSTNTNASNAYSLTKGTDECFNSDNTVIRYAYKDPSSDEAILSGITPSLVQLKELCIANININAHPNEEFPGRRTFVSCKRHMQLTAEALSELWHIGPKRAKSTIVATTQHGIRSAILPLSRRYRSDRMYNIKRLQGRFATDTFFADMTSLNSNTCCQIYSHKCGFMVCYPLADATGDSLGTTLHDFVHDFGAPSHLTFDGFSSQVGTKSEFNKALRKYKIEWHVSAPRRPNETLPKGQSEN